MGVPEKQIFGEGDSFYLRPVDYDGQSQMITLGNPFIPVAFPSIVNFIGSGVYNISYYVGVEPSLQTSFTISLLLNYTFQIRFL